MSKDINSLIADQVAIEVAKRLDVSKLADGIIAAIDVQKIAEGMSSGLEYAARQAAEDVTFEFSENGIYLDTDTLGNIFDKYLEHHFSQIFAVKEKGKKKAKKKSKK